MPEERTMIAMYDQVQRMSRGMTALDTSKGVWVGPPQPTMGIAMH